MLKTGIGFRLYYALFTRYLIINAVLTAVIQSSLPHPPHTDVSFTALPLDSEDTTQLLHEAQRYMMFSTAAYGTMEMDAADKVLPPMMAAGPVRGIIDAKTKELKKRIAEYLNITEDHILHISYPGDSGGIIPHFVAIDNATESLVLAIRGTNSLTGLYTDVRAKNSK